MMPPGMYVSVPWMMVSGQMVYATWNAQRKAWEFPQVLQQQGQQHK